MKSRIFNKAYLKAWYPLNSHLEDISRNGQPSLVTINELYTSSGGMDEDVLNVMNAIIAAGGTLDGWDIKAINSLILSAKSMGQWDNCIGLYGYIGGTAASHAINWKNPGTYDLTWNGTFVHDGNGSAPQDTSSYADTGFDVGNFDDFHIMMGSVTSWTGNIAGTNGSYPGIRVGYSAPAYAIFGAFDAGSEIVNPRVDRSHSIFTVMKLSNGNLGSSWVGSGGPSGSSSGTQPTGKNLLFGKAINTGSTNLTMAFSSFGPAFESTDAFFAYANVNTFMNNLGR